MPFTLSHAAAVLPGIRRDGTARGPLVASALVTGSFAPDITYFADSAIPGAMEFGDFTHSPAGVVTVDTLISAALVGLWLLLREPLLALAPRAWRGRAYAFVRGQQWRGRGPAGLAALFYLSAALGAATHVVWDSFTHLDTWGTRVFPVLGEIIAGFPLYLYFQYGGSAIALLCIGWFTWTALRRTPRSPVPVSLPVLRRRELWWAAALLAVCMAGGILHRCLRFYAYWGEIRTPLDIIPTACFGAGAGLVPGLVLYAVGVRLLHRSRDARTEPPRQPVHSGTTSR
ncbi:DUF4184 family protein [Streptomyces sp. NBC_00829]|uniref:DUF4184 family protein n=1 Tax=Streptomyces sp. NBC_00829 TaxID=2903679 RepID=UPI00386737D0|nr:DUF4184 family protein [Streptomyces sp. NBC_00829]